jgi:hypothetical protein
MQNAKDTFYLTLRDRLATLNPGRTLVLRGVVRPASLVEENELSSVNQTLDAFCLRWTALGIHAPGILSMQCEIRYRTEGSTGSGGMDRGRLLSAMDGELIAAVNTAPQNAPKRTFATATSAITTGTNLFWGNVQFVPATVEAERIGRVATVEVFAYQEAGEL